MSDVRVAPVTDVCRALNDWAKASGKGDWPSQFEAMKSNLLYRLVYLGEPLRTEKCPAHKGEWSGCKFDLVCDCQKIIWDGAVTWDANVCGWLLDGNPPIGKLPPPA